MEICGIIGPAEISIIFLIVGLGVVFLGLTLVAIIDVLRNEFTENNKLIWILVILFLGPLGAILYFVLGKQHKIKPN
jgi:cytochrome bd-type quinol oxidase subunit 1